LIRIYDYYNEENMTNRNFTDASYGVSSPEVKALGMDSRSAVHDLMGVFEEFKETNDARLRDLERRMTTDVLHNEKLTRLDHALTEAQKRLERLSIESRRPLLSPELSEKSAEGMLTEHKMAFEQYMRSGESLDLRRLEEKGLSSGVGSDGGYLVPNDIERDVLGRLGTLSPIRSLATVRTISSGAYKRAVSIKGPACGWVSETAIRPETTKPELAEVAFPAIELYAMPAATQTFLDDAMVDVDSWLAQEVEVAFSEQEGKAFVSGDGVDKPKGFLAYPTVAQNAWIWGKIGTVTTGDSAGFAKKEPYDSLIDLIAALKPGYRQNGTFIMNRRTQSILRKFKDTTGEYLWRPSIVAGQPATLLSFPVVEVEDMPDLGANTMPVAFGDFRRGYVVVDRAGISVLRDPYSLKPYVLFYTTKRVGGGVQDFDAIKLLKCSA
jgi:HK97 family phage major capsid protein